jgi:hypothetical protein
MAFLKRADIKNFITQSNAVQMPQEKILIQFTDKHVFGSVY